MAELWDAGIRGASLDVVAAWKDVLLAVALVVALLGARSVPLRLWADRLALAYAAFVLALLARCRRAGSTAPRRTAVSSSPRGTT